MFRKPLSILLYMLLAVSMLFSLTACSGSSQRETTVSEPDGSTPPGTLQTPEDLELTENEHYGYLKTPIDGLESAYGLTLYNDTVYVITDNGLTMYKNGTLTQFYAHNESFIFSMDAANDGIWMLETLYDSSSQGAYLSLLDYNGSVLFRSDINTVPGYDAAWGDAYCLKAIDGKCYILFANAVVLMDADTLTITGICETESKYPFALCRNGSGVFVMAHVEGGYACEAIDKASGLQTFQLSSDIYGIYDAPGESGLYYSTSAGLYRISDGINPETVIDWSENAITNELFQAVVPYNDGFFIIDNFTPYMLTPGIIKPRTIIRMAAVLPLNTISKYISQFNRTNTDYYVEVDDMYSTYGSRENAVTALNTQLLAGQGPDIIYFGGSPDNVYGTLGYLLNLYDLIDCDPDMNRSDFLCLTAMETQGSLYTITPGFFVDTYIGLSSVFGDRSGWTFDEYFDMESARSDDRPMVHNITRDSFLENSLRSYLPAAVDWVSGTCDFNNAEFIAILEASANIIQADESLDREYMTQTPELLLAEDINVIQGEYLSGILQFARAEQNINQDLCFIGWPSPNGENTSMLSPLDSLGISALSKTSEASWAFIKYLIADDALQENIGASMFPILKSALENQIYALLHPLFEFEGKDVTIGEQGGFYVDGVFYDMEYDTTPMITQKQADKVMTLLESLEQNTASDKSILAIVLEEAAAYFAGDKTAQETAALIQSRAQLYVAEQS